jgi:myo-inositol-1(or 4)-monophosphatase
MTSLSVIQLADALSFARALAEESAAYASSQIGLGGARRKIDGTLVTQTDEHIDRLISQRIHQHFPEHTVLSEEQTAIYDPLVAYTWVVDPLDGTTNFARGLPTWGVSIGLLVDGAPVMGVVNFPLLREEFTATLGNGAHRNGIAIHSGSEDPVDDEHLFMECTRSRKSVRFTLPLKSRMLGSAAYHLCKVADGSALAGSERTPMVWDIAAAGVILSEAGGVLQGTDGESVFPLPPRRLDYRGRPMPVLYAASAEKLAQVRAARHAQPS